MGHAPREKVVRLPEKLLAIRSFLNLSQNQLIKYLNLEEKLIREDISKFELGIREPALPTLLKYARAMGISTDILIDDEAEINFNGEENQQQLNRLTIR